VWALDEEIEKLEDLLSDDSPHDGAVQRRSFEGLRATVSKRSSLVRAPNFA
jgi:magnesium transporter